MRRIAGDRFVGQLRSKCLDVGFEPYDRMPSLLSGQLQVVALGYTPESSCAAEQLIAPRIGDVRLRQDRPLRLSVKLCCTGWPSSGTMPLL